MQKILLGAFYKYDQCYSTKWVIQKICDQYCYFSETGAAKDGSKSADNESMAIRIDKAIRINKND